MKQRPKRMTIDALDRGIDVLEVLAERGSVRLAELPDLLGVSRATAFRVLKTLEDRGYVDHMRCEHAYRLGPGSVILAACSQTSSIIRLAETAMAELRDVTGEAGQRVAEWCRRISTDLGHSAPSVG